jgi:peptidoglycan/LPS O-acetylase OafA/YrhL
MKSNRYDELDALRGIAALSVVFFHLTMGRPEGQSFFKLGVTGVELFFIISGFVIYMSLNKIKSSLEFVINRTSRLYPTYWTVVTFTFFLISIKSFYKFNTFPPDNLTIYLGNMTMFQYCLGIRDLDGPYWTMIIEMVFYIGILFLFHFRALKFLNIIGITLSIVAVIMATFQSNFVILNRILHLLPVLNFIPLFFAGTILYKIHQNKSKLLQNYIILIICLICQIALFRYSGSAPHYITHLEFAIMLTIYISLFILFVNGKLRFIVSKTTLFFGKISFPLYLIHQEISLEVIIPALTRKFHMNFWIASFFVALPIVIILASLITFYIEIPVRKQMREKLYGLAFKNSADLV